MSKISGSCCCEGHVGAAASSCELGTICQASQDTAARPRRRAVLGSASTLSHNSLVIYLYKINKLFTTIQRTKRRVTFSSRPSVPSFKSYTNLVTIEHSLL